VRWETTSTMSACSLTLSSVSCESLAMTFYFYSAGLTPRSSRYFVRQKRSVIPAR
jgi:hypothetical protein